MLRRFKSYPIFLSVWRNWIARQTSNLKVAGSIPVMDTFGSVPERSKGSDLRSLALCFVGSNPTATTSPISSVGQSASLMSSRSWVRAPHRILTHQLIGKAGNPIDYQFSCSIQEMSGIFCLKECLVSWCNLVSTLDFESNDPGSNPGETFFSIFFFYFKI